MKNIVDFVVIVTMGISVGGWRLEMGFDILYVLSTHDILYFGISQHDIVA